MWCKCPASHHDERLDYPHRILEQVPPSTCTSVTSEMGFMRPVNHDCIAIVDTYAQRPADDKFVTVLCSIVHPDHYLMNSICSICFHTYIFCQGSEGKGVITSQFSQQTVPISFLFSWRDPNSKYCTCSQYFDYQLYVHIMMSNNLTLSYCETSSNCNTSFVSYTPTDLIMLQSFHNHPAANRKSESITQCVVLRTVPLIVLLHVILSVLKGALQKVSHHRDSHVHTHYTRHFLFVPVPSLLCLVSIPTQCLLSVPPLTPNLIQIVFVRNFANFLLTITSHTKIQIFLHDSLPHHTTDHTNPSRFASFFLVFPFCLAFGLDKYTSNYTSTSSTQSSKRTFANSGLFIYTFTRYKSTLDSLLSLLSTVSF